MRGLFVITFIYVLFIAVMVPLDNKAYLDDFAYAQSVKHLVVDGYFKISDWTAVTFIAQLFWGALFSYILGFSHATLAISTMTLFYLGLIAFYFTLRELQLDDFKSTFFTLCFFSYPFIPLLTVSFMTDIPYLSFFLIALLFYTKGLNLARAALARLKFLLIGSVFASLAFLTRQTGLILPLAAALVLIYHSKFKPPKFTRTLLFSRLPYLLCVLVLPVLTAIVYLVWNKDNHTYGQFYALRHILWPTVSNLPQILSRILFYLANIFIFIWPIFLIFVSKKLLKKILTKRAFLTLLILSFITVITFRTITGNNLQFIPIHKPFANNYSYFIKILPYQTLKNIWIINLVITLAVLSITPFFNFKLSATFISLAFFLHFVWTLILPFAWAEYAVAFLPFVIIAIALKSQKLAVNKFITVIIIIILIVPSVLNAKITHLVLGNAWVRGEKLVQNGVSPAVIDTGSYAWYPWWYYDETFAAALAKAGGDKRKLKDLQTWEHPKEEDYQYKLNFGKL